MEKTTKHSHLGRLSPSAFQIHLHIA